MMIFNESVDILVSSTCFVFKFVKNCSNVKHILLCIESTGRQKAFIKFGGYIANKLSGEVDDRNIITFNLLCII